MTDGPAVNNLFYPVSTGNVHVEQIAEHFGTIEPDGTLLPDDMKYVIMCFTNRSGSNYLAELLASSGSYNCAGETLNGDVVVKRASRLGHESFQQYFRWLSVKQSQSGHFFVKAALSQLELLGRAGLLQQILPRTRFLLIERSDKLAQAISHVIAFTTRRFMSTQEGKMAPEEVVFSAQKIDAILNGIASSYSGLDLFFARNGIVPVQVIYEQLTADPEGYMKFVGAQLGLADFELDMKNIRLERQANAINLQWRSAYLASARMPAKGARPKGEIDLA